MNNIYAIVLFLVVITTMSSTLCVYDGDKEISEVVDAQTNLHDEGIKMSKVNSVQIDKFLSEDAICIDPEQPCTGIDPCCGELYCDFYNGGICKPKSCLPKGGECHDRERFEGADPCCPPLKCFAPEKYGPSWCE